MVCPSCITHPSCFPLSALALAHAVQVMARRFRLEGEVLNPLLSIVQAAFP